MSKQLILAALALAAVGCGPKVPQLGKSSLDKVVGAMTLEEKAHLVIGTGMAGFSGDDAVIGETRNIVPGAAGTTYPIERLGIPAIVLADGPAGLRISPVREGDENTYYCTHFPIGTLLASTWNEELIESVGKSIGEEVLEYGADVLLAPALNIHRNPLCGRNFEYYSEDPLVAGKTAAAYVRGVQSNGVGTSIKHFAINNQETNRMNTDARVSQRAIREIYLKGFEIAVKESDPWTVMSSYNHINGTYASESKDLLTDILRDDWGYTGTVMTDWFGGRDAAAQVVAGNDMLQPGRPDQFEGIVNGVKNGTLDEKLLDRNVKRILSLILKSPHFKGYKYSNKPNLQAHAAVTRQAAAEGMVLLENREKALPLSKDIKKVALFGMTSYDIIAGGTGSGDVNHAYVVSLTEGLSNAGYSIDEDLRSTYQEYVKVEDARLNANAQPFMPHIRPSEMLVSAKLLDEQVQNSDAAIITLGRTSGEFLDRNVSDFSLSAEEHKLIEDVCESFHAVGKKVIVVLNIGGVIETASWKELPDAILLAWQAGQEGGNSIADVLSGKSSPSGKLTMSFPLNFDDAASSENFPIDAAPRMVFMPSQQQGNANERNVDYTEYQEDIYVGYRYFDSFDKAVSYPFGYGLSYTEFEYSNPSIAAKKGVYSIAVDIKNVGEASGKEVVELYVAAPNSKQLNKPEKELKAYAKTAELAPGQTAHVVLEVKASELASFNEEKSAWVVDEGNYKFLVGASSRDIRASLSSEVEPSEQKVSSSLTLQNEIELLRR